jgi:LmbE family N-acetylglucosaminyl deacetylase
MTSSPARLGQVHAGEIDPLPPFSAHDRILIFAPHPDDEALATGGLIQRAVAAGARVRVVFATDGENNPWPQRVVERRLQVRPNDRARWGKRRRKEAMLAISHFGLPADAARFLGFADQGVTRFLLSASEIAVAAIADAIVDWMPTLLVVPSLSDVHPDHSALSVLIRLALSQMTHEPDVLTFVVHTRGRISERHRVVLHLSEEEQLVKRQAILCHASQMKLSRGRFLAYAKPLETFYKPRTAACSDPHSPIWHAAMEDGALRLHIRRRWLAKPGATVYAALQSFERGDLRWKFPLRATSRRAHVCDARTGEDLRFATMRIEGRNAIVTFPIAPLQPVRSVFVKLDGRLGFFDDAGWREVPVARTATSGALRAVSHAVS